MRKMEIFHALETARRYAQAGQLQQAEKIYQKILQADPVHVAAINQLGILYHSAGRGADACDLFARAIQARPQVAAFYSNRAVALWTLGRVDEALAAARRAVELDARDASSWQNLGNMLQQHGDLPGAAEAFKRSADLRENSAIHAKLLSVLMPLGRADEALPIARRAAEKDPGNANSHANLAIVAMAASQFDQAEQAYRRALELAPDDAMIHNGLGILAIRRSDHATALRCFRKAIELAPGDQRLNHNLAGVLLDCGYTAEAINLLRAEVQSAAPIEGAFDSLLLAMQYNDRSDPQEIFQTHQRWYERCAAPLAALAQPHTNSADPQRRLRVGYVSPDFRQHSVGRFIEPILASHDHHQFDIYCYSAVKKPDDATARMSQQVDHWRPIIDLTREKVIEIIREDQIDILIDLSGHTEDSRLLVFAAKPAPVQITYLGYPNTTGLPQVDYRLTDAISDPPGIIERFYTEELIRLPDTAWCYRPPDHASGVAPLPALANGYITFGSFNNISKLSDHTISLWSRLLTGLPDSRLLIKAAAMPEPGMDRLRNAFAGHGIAEPRLELLPSAPTTESHLCLYERVDIGLDPFPYNGTTTTCEALYMGVPVVTRAGQSHASRVGASLLTTVGSPEWIAGSDEQFVEIASNLARDLDSLALLRHSLRERMRQSPLMDAPRFTRDLEAAYRELWRRWCQAP